MENMMEKLVGRWNRFIFLLLHHRRFHLPLLFVFLLFQSPEAEKKGFDVSQCESALGMQNRFIEDSDITASSTIDNRRRGPANARIRTEKGDGAWCPKTPISSESYEYLEIDLRQLKVIKLVETQGRFENGQGTEYADQYRLEYQREDGETWFRYKNRRGHEIIQGNSNTYIAELRELRPVLVARRVRFVPISSHPRNVCLRVEMYGCKFTDGVTSYEMPQGHRYGPDIDLIDRFYDGTVEAGVLRRGLGLLMDGDEGQANFQLDESETGVKTFQWIGWKNENLSNTPLSIVFRFDALRNFSMVNIRCNNMFSKGVRVFRLVQMYFGLDGKSFGTEPEVRYTYARDNQAEYARTVKIPLENRIGRYIKMELFFDVTWIMISEIHFESEYVKADVIGEDGGGGGGGGGGRRQVLVDHVTFSPSRTIRISGLAETESDDVTSRSSDHRRHNTAAPPSLPGNDVIYVNDRTRNGVNSEVHSSTVLTSLVTTGRWGQTGLKNDLDYGSVVVMIIVLAVLLFVLCSVLGLIFYRRHKLTCIPGPCGESKSSAILTNPPSSSSISRPSSLLYPSSYLIHSTSSAYRPAFPPVPSYHADDPSHSTASDLLISPSLVSPYAVVDLPGEGHSDESSLDGVYSTPASLQLLPGVMAMPLPLQSSASRSVGMGGIPRSSLKFVRSLGEGHFGQVYVCEVLDGYGNGGRSESGLITDQLTSVAGTTVCVKVLQHGASDLKRSLFEREVRKLSRLQDPNIASMLTYYSDQEPFCIVLDYSPIGDLKSFLRERSSDPTIRDSPQAAGCDLLSYGCLLFIASQIASGMKCFEQQELVHRDLSARNCIVDEHLTVKISDLGTGHHQYPEDYSTCTAGGQVLLPVRWMAWESVLLGNFTIKSDIWAFAVTVWEIITMAAELPYVGLTDEQVVENCHNIYCESVTTDPQRLPRPHGCPRELYDLLCHCWVKDESQRPSFREVDMFLAKKSAGFKPQTLSIGGGQPRPCYF